MGTYLRKLSDRVVHQSHGVGAVHVARLRSPSGEVHTWSYLVKRPFVVVVACTRRGVVFVRQHRYPQRRPTWELVKGGVERRESPVRSAQRELVEETGYRASRWQRLGQFVIAPGYFHQRGYVYLARALRTGRHRPETGEVGLEVAVIPWQRIPRYLREGAINDSTTLAGLYLAMPHLRRRR